MVRFCLNSIGRKGYFGQTDTLLAVLEKYRQRLYKSILKVRVNGERFTSVAAQNFCQKISKLLSKLSGKYFPALTQQNRDLGGCSLEQDGVDFYIVGADAVRKKLTGNDIYEIAYNEGNGWAGKGTIQLDVTNIPDYATLSLDSFKYVALLSSSGTGGATEEITGSYMGVKVLGYDSGSGKLSIQTANAYRPIFIVVIE